MLIKPKHLRTRVHLNRNSEKKNIPNESKLKLKIKNYSWGKSRIRRIMRYH